MKISHGVNSFNHAESTPLSVCTIRDRFGSALGLIGGEVALVNGVEVSETKVVQPHENIQFVKKAGTKG